MRYLTRELLTARCGDLREVEERRGVRDGLTDDREAPARLLVGELAHLGGGHTGELGEDVVNGRYLDVGENRPLGRAQRDQPVLWPPEEVLRHQLGVALGDKALSDGEQAMSPAAAISGCSPRASGGSIGDLLPSVRGPVA